MPREYRTIEEAAGPLLLVKDVEGVKYGELAEIRLANGEKRRCRVLEIDGTNAMVQLFENAAGIIFRTAALYFRVTRWNSAYRRICSDEFLTVSDARSTTVLR